MKDCILCALDVGDMVTIGKSSQLFKRNPRKRMFLRMNLQSKLTQKTYHLMWWRATPIRLQVVKLMTTGLGCLLSVTSRNVGVPLTWELRVVCYNEFNCNKKNTEDFINNY